VLLPRFLTALVGAPVLLLSVWLGGLPFLFLVLGIVLLGAREFYRLAEEGGYATYPLIGFVCCGLTVLSVFINGQSFGQVTDNQATPALMALFVAAILMRSLYVGPRETSLSEWSVTFFGIIYVGWSLSHLVLLRDLRPYGFYATLLLFCLIWAEDICAYLVGMRIGKRRIAESISPKKTWEGTIGGLFAAIVISLLFQMSVLREALGPIEAVGLAIVTGILAFSSDLAESVLKRTAGVKDSSVLLPGHGGILDRFDSFVLATPFFYYYWAFLKH
jgi:phosphatidate cytidylyltransferase